MSINKLHLADSTFTLHTVHLLSCSTDFFLKSFFSIEIQLIYNVVSLEKEMATHSSILAWKIPGTEEPGGIQSMEPQGVGHD